MKSMLLTGALIAAFVAAGAAQAAGDAAAGKAKSVSCAKCHGANGEGKGKYPAVTGISEGEFVQMLEDYKSGKKANGIMKSYSSKLSAQDMADLAAYYASLKK